jgi:tRNA (guanine-N7-)-methyltransferase
MRPNDFLIPQEQFAENKPLIFDRVFYVPENSEDKPFVFPGWESLFGNANPVSIEYCSGNGCWITKKAQENPHINWVAVERQMSRGRKIWSKLHNSRLENLIVVVGEGEECTRRFFASGSISDAYVNFPDPWPKRRHAKNRIINPRFIAEMARILRIGCCLTLVTDDASTSKIMIETVLKNPQFSSVYPSPHYLSNPQNFGSSYFDTLWRGKGKEIRLHKFQINSL